MCSVRPVALCCVSASSLIRFPVIFELWCVLIMCLMLFQRYLPREVDPLVYNMSHEDPGSVSYSEIGGLSEQIRELREVQPSLSQSLSHNIIQDTSFLICMVELCLEGFCFR